MKARDILIALYLKYDGDWDKIYSAIKDKKTENLNTKKIKQLRVKYETNFNFITLLDEEYPEQLKHGYKPPFVIMYYGNINLLHEPLVGVYNSSLGIEAVANVVEMTEDGDIVINNNELNIVTLENEDLTNMFCSLYNKLVVGKYGARTRKSELVTLALQNDKEVYVEPTAEKSFNNELIKEGANLIDSPKDLLD